MLQPIIIQSFFRKNKIRNKYLNIKKKTVILQSFFRKLYCKKNFLKKIKQIKLIQIKFRQYYFKNKKSLKNLCLKKIKENIHNIELNEVDIFLLEDCKIFYDDGITKFNDLKFTNSSYQKILVLKILQFFNQFYKENKSNLGKLSIKIINIFLLGNYFSNKTFKFEKYSRLDDILLSTDTTKNNLYDNFNIYLNNNYNFEILKNQICTIDSDLSSDNLYVRKVIKYFKILKFIISLNYKQNYSLIKIQRWWSFNIKLKTILKYKNFQIFNIIKKIQSVIRRYIIKYSFKYIERIKLNFPYKIKKLKNIDRILGKRIQVLWWKRNSNRTKYIFYKGNISDHMNQAFSNKLYEITYDDNEVKFYELDSKTSYIFKDIYVLYYTTFNRVIEYDFNLDIICKNPLFLIGKKIFLQCKYFLILNFNFITMAYLAISYPLKNTNYKYLEIINAKIKFKIIKNVISIFEENI